MTMEKRVQSGGALWNDGSECFSPKTKTTSTPPFLSLRDINSLSSDFPLSMGQLSLYDMKMQIFLQIAGTERLMKDGG